MNKHEVIVKCGEEVLLADIKDRIAHLQEIVDKGFEKIIAKQEEINRHYESE